MSLLETLVAIFIFSIGVLGLLAAFASATTTSGEAQYRLEASNQAQEILQQIWATTQRDAKGSIASGALDSYNFDSANSTCGVTGSTAPASLCSWYNALSAAKTGLPGAKASVVVDSSSAAHNRVTVTISWVTPSGARRHQVIGHVN